MTTRESADIPPKAALLGKNPGRGRPPVHENEAAKQRVHRAARRERAVLVDALLHAVRNAHWDEPGLQAVIQEGDDAALLRALTDYYKQRHWMCRRSDLS